ncbi:MAG: transaldolase [Chloroflexi bacterium]|nr:transaldolase [Chloroflexota bacterium]
MEIFLDSADLTQIKRWLDYGLIDGVTTNPSILLKEGGNDIEARARDIAAMVFPRPVSVEVYTNDLREMVEQARGFVRWGSNIVVKIPVINEQGEPCLGVVRALADEGIAVNMTACLSFGQVAMGAKVGATYCSIFAGRVSDEGHDAAKLVRQSVDWLGAWGYRTKIIVGSVREAINLQDAALAGAHVLTAPPQFLDKWIDHYYTRATVAGFNRDAQAALAKIREEGVVAPQR